MSPWSPGRRRPAADRWHATLVAWLAIQAGCARAPQTPGSAAVCTVSRPDGSERVVLVSEAQANDGQRERSTFVLSAPAGETVTLTLTAVGCSCYRVHQGERPLRVGDTVTVAAGSTADLCIESQLRTSPGQMHYRAEFSGRDRRGTVFDVPLTCSIRTIADLTVRPDVMQHTISRVRRHPQAGIPVSIEQHIRAKTPADLRVTWTATPDWIDCSEPTLAGEPVEICPGVWRARWRSAVGVGDVPEPPPKPPVQLRLESYHAQRRLASTDCTLLVKQNSGIQAPELVHFGRLPTGAAPRRRVQVIARDDLPFVVHDISSLRGEVSATELHPGRKSAEHWLDVQIGSFNGTVDDVLTLETDHPETPEVRIRVRALGGGESAAGTAAKIRN